MAERDPIARYLAVALLVVGSLEWLLGRVVSRLAAAPPLEGAARAVVELLGRAGLFLISTAFLLALALYVGAALDLGDRANRSRKTASLALAIYLVLFAAFTTAHALFLALAIFRDEAWLSVTFNLLSLIAVWWLVGRYLASQDHVAGRMKVGVLLVALAYSGWYVSVLGSWAGLSDSTAWALRMGELAAVLAPVAFFAAIALPGGEGRVWKRWIAPAVLFLLFAIGNVADMMAGQGFTGVLSIWSVGFTLWLPWPLYGLSLALYLYSLLTCFSAKRSAERSPIANADTGLGLLLLLFAGFQLQLTYQHLLALLSLMLLTGLLRPLSREDAATEERDERVPAPTT